MSFHALCRAQTLTNIRNRPVAIPADVRNGVVRPIRFLSSHELTALAFRSIRADAGPKLCRLREKGDRSATESQECAGGENRLRCQIACMDIERNGSEGSAIPQGAAEMPANSWPEGQGKKELHIFTGHLRGGGVAMFPFRFGAPAPKRGKRRGAWGRPEPLGEGPKRIARQLALAARRRRTIPPPPLSLSPHRATEPPSWLRGAPRRFDR